MKIKNIFAYHQLDSRGYPTIGVIIESNDNLTSKVLIPSGASTGIKEAVELRDNEEKNYFGKSVFKAIDNINNIIAPKLIGLDFTKQDEIDQIMIDLDGTKNKSNLGANAILAVSLAIAKISAQHFDIPLYEYIATHLLKTKINKKHFPMPMINVLNGGAHSDNSLDFQEFMIVPISANSISESIKMGSEVFYSLGIILKNHEKPTSKGDEGGYSPDFESIDELFKILNDAIIHAGYIPETDIVIGIDVAASEFCAEDNSYFFKKAFLKNILSKEESTKTSKQLLDYYLDLKNKFPIKYIEDPFDEENWEYFKLITENSNIEIIGDDLYCTNIDLLTRGIKERSSNGILIKLNQIGSLSETLKCIKAAQNANIKITISHRSGETCDSTIADLAIAVGAEKIKTGSFSRSERISKYNRLLEIEQNFLHNKFIFK